MYECDYQEDCLNYQKECLLCKRNLLASKILRAKRDYYKSKTAIKRQKASAQRVKDQFQVGDLVSFRGKLKREDDFQKITGKLVKRNPKRALLDCGDLGLTRVPYQMLKKETAKTSTFLQTKKVVLEKPTEKLPSLAEMLQEVKEEYQEIFQELFSEKEMLLLATVTIKWNNKKTFRLAGKYSRVLNQIWISISLKGVPKEVTKSTIFHELLHIHYTKHSKYFRYYERKFKDFEKCKQYTAELFRRILNGSDKK